jgi:hypothetical protein
MGGIGSGEWIRWNNRPVIEEFRRIDIRYFKQAGLLQEGCTGLLSWSIQGETTGAVNFQMKQEFLLLNYRSRKNDQAWRNINTRVEFDRTHCHYGGERKWFLCPQCCRRALILCLVGDHFLCRLCAKSPYGSQRETVMDRKARKARKIRKQLGVEMDLERPIFDFDRPKGMHQRTFKRLVENENIAQRIYSAHFNEKVCRLLKKDSN